ncbi:MAG: UDP-N-acetylmuramoyl-L-alanyl-D-glutamate--2,6-diaminopimelate ligase [Bellilinea sp.]
MTTNLAKIFTQIPIIAIAPAKIPALTITGIALDSRQVQPGYLFVALTGGSVDGHRFIPVAVAQGAAAVVGQQPAEGFSLPVPYIQVDDTRRALAYCSAAFYDFPARKLTIIGVTGTDGKTTTSNLLYTILKHAGKRVGIISTVSAVIGDEVIDTGFHVTTPEAPDVQHYLAQMAAAGLTHVVLEATSHGLAQERVTACEFDIGVVTNITHEHLDYHGSYEAYRVAKARLFQHLLETVEKPQGNPRLAVLNYDDQSFGFLSDFTQTNKLSYGLDPHAMVHAVDVCYSPAGMQFTALFPDGQQAEVHSHLVGKYNVSNILAAMTAAVGGLGMSPQQAAAGVERLDLIPGRMEHILLGQDFTAIVDFAHTPNALKVTLETAREMTNGRVLAVFGSAGLRDREKRRMMAEISAQLADLTFLTAEDPRTESLDAILAEMAQSATEQGGVEGQTFWRVPDRREAIRIAINMAQPGDLVLALGKGHEQSMCFDVTEYPWDDRTAMRAALAERLKLPGYAMPFLPNP